MIPIGLVWVVILLLIAGVVLALFPVDPTIRRVLVAILVVVALLALLSAVGILPAVRFR